jgi:7-carboxy-7-deazaguanine synthase
MNPSMKLTVNEIFHSIQGESVHAGLPCTFVRLTGCNLRCRYCDTRYAFYEGTPMTIAQIVYQVSAFGCRLVEITGGEPLLQAHTPTLISALLDGGYHVLMETNGSLNIDRVDSRCVRIMDVKCPSSGEHVSNDSSNLLRLRANDQVKFVIGDRADFHFATHWVSRLPSLLPADRILFSAVSDQLPLDQLAAWMLESRIKARLQLQLHKVIWPHRTSGV